MPNEIENEQYLEIDSLIANLQIVPEGLNYWLIRTQSGKYYDSFRENGFVAINYEEISINNFFNINHKYKGNKKYVLKDLKMLAQTTYPQEKLPGVIASQIYKFIEEINQYDKVIIPSHNSSIISIGEVIDLKLSIPSSEEVERTECPYLKRRKVRWLKHIDRDDLDLNLYRLLHSHRAVSKITDYADSIERYISNFYILFDETNLIFQVEQERDINARQLFEFGTGILNYAEDFFKYAKLDLTVDDIEVKINLNSKGKLQLKSLNPRNLWLIAVLFVGIAGGGLKINYGGKPVLDLSTPGIIQKVIEYQNQNHDRNIVDTLLKNRDSLKIKTPDDAVKLLKQFSTNKDLAK